MPSAISFSYIEQKTVGSRREPCGTPEDTLHRDEKQSSITTCWERSLKKDCNHVTNFP